MFDGLWVTENDGDIIIDQEYFGQAVITDFDPTTTEAPQPILTLESTSTDNSDNLAISSSTTTSEAAPSTNNESGVSSYLPSREPVPTLSPQALAYLQTVRTFGRLPRTRLAGVSLFSPYPFIPQRLVAQSEDRDVDGGYYVEGTPVSPTLLTPFPGLLPNLFLLRHPYPAWLSSTNSPLIML
jgi:hypothetical protein